MVLNVGSTKGVPGVTMVHEEEREDVTEAPDTRLSGARAG